MKKLSNILMVVIIVASMTVIGCKKADPAPAVVADSTVVVDSVIVAQ